MASPHAAVLVRALTTDPPQIQPEDVPALIAAGLAGEVRARLPEAHPLRQPLWPAHLALSVRHTLIRRELRQLIAAWVSEGIPVLLFKGFSLAEFEYATPGERFYGDVDVLLPDDPAVLIRAAHLALALGWRSDGLHAAPGHWTHESAHLLGPSGETRLDVHHAVTWLGGRRAQARALTRALWAGAQPLDWDGLPIWRPSPGDALVITLVLNRQWGGDQGGLKPADYADARVLLRRHPLTPEHLEERARQLGAVHTWATFRQLCNPEQRQFVLDDPQISAQLHQAAVRDGVPHNPRVWFRRWNRALPRLRSMVNVLPDTLAAWWAIRKGGDPRLHLARWITPEVERTLPYAQMEDVVAGVWWSTRMLYPRQSQVGTCLPRAYATYRALRRRGYPAVFVNGVARLPGGIQGHAWIEAPDGVLAAYGEPLNRERFATTFQYPD